MPCHARGKERKRASKKEEAEKEKETYLFQHSVYTMPLGDFLVLQTKRGICACGLTVSMHDIGERISAHTEWGCRLCANSRIHGCGCREGSTLKGEYHSQGVR